MQPQLITTVDAGNVRISSHTCSLTQTDAADLRLAEEFFSRDAIAVYIRIG